MWCLCGVCVVLVWCLCGNMNTSQTAVVQIQALAAEAAKQVTTSAQKHKRRLIRQQQRYV